MDMADSHRILEGRRGEGFRNWEAAANVVAQIVRKLSGAGRFANAADVLEELEGLALLPEAADEVIVGQARDAERLGAFAAHDPADERRQRGQVPSDCAGGLARIPLC